MRKLHLFIMCTVAFVLAVSAPPIMVLGQSRTTKSRATPLKATKLILKTISLGVINGKAIELVKPNYPPVAIAVSVSGSVFVNVLIDVNGKVVTAKSRRGHPLLVPASIKAALASTFEPIAVGGNPVQVTGVIVYRYLSSSMNWLELGYSADSIDTLTQYLPAGFSEERSFLELSKSNQSDTGPTLDAAWSIINGKLGSDEKARWLIAVGRRISKLSRLHWDAATKKALFSDIGVLLDTCPENVSVNLKSRLKNLIDPEDVEEFDDNLISLTDNLYQLGR